MIDLPPFVERMAKIRQLSWTYCRCAPFDPDEPHWYLYAMMVFEDGMHTSGLHAKMYQLPSTWFLSQTPEQPGCCHIWYDIRNG